MSRWPLWAECLVWVLIALFLVVMAVQIARADHDHEKRRCFVRYAPDKVRDFSDLWTVKHRDGSKMVNYLMDDGNVVPERYKNAEQAEYWIVRVYKQLRECN